MGSCGGDGVRRVEGGKMLNTPQECGTHMLAQNGHDLFRPIWPKAALA